MDYIHFTHDEMVMRTDLAAVQLDIDGRSALFILNKVWEIEPTNDIIKKMCIS